MGLSDVFLFFRLRLYLFGKMVWNQELQEINMSSYNLIVIASLMYYLAGFFIVKWLFFSCN